MLEYKGYRAEVTFDDSIEVFHGRVIGLRDVISFQAERADEVRAAFQESIDDYLTWCEEEGVSPDREYSGRFPVRIDPGLHRRAAIAAEADGESLNSWTEKVIRERVGS